MAIALDLARPDSQETCPPLPQSGDPGWAKNAQVTVIFDGPAGFTQDQMDAMEQACNNWNASNGPQETDLV